MSDELEQRQDAVREDGEVASSPEGASPEQPSASSLGGEAVNSAADSTTEGEAQAVEGRLVRIEGLGVDWVLTGDAGLCTQKVAAGVVDAAATKPVYTDPSASG